MKRTVDPWSDIGLPVVATMGVFCALKLVWSRWGLDEHLPRGVANYMVGSLVALAFLARAIRRGTLTLEQIGCGVRGWRPGRRLLGLTLTVLLVAAMYLSPSEAVTPLRFGDFCFWFFFLLQASLAELLIFVSVGYCLPEVWLRGRGWPTWKVVLVAGLFSSVTFGWHHYTGGPDDYQWAWVTIPVMWLNLALFLATRNVYLPLLLHNGIAAVGFTQTQHSHDPPRHWENPATYFTPFYLTSFIVAFTLPYLLLHALEWWGATGATEARHEDAAPPNQAPGEAAEAPASAESVGIGNE